LFLILEIYGFSSLICKFYWELQPETLMNPTQALQKNTEVCCACET